jgi:hypothetical protein
MALDTNTPFERFAKCLSLSKQFILDFGSIGLMVLGFVFFFAVFLKEVGHREIILDPIEVPEDIAKLGYKGTVVATLIKNKAHIIDMGTRERSKSGLFFRNIGIALNFDMNASTVDILVPGETFSIKTLTRFVRQEFGLDTHLQGEIIHENDDYVLILHNLSLTNVPAVHILLSGKVIDQFLLEEKGGSGLGSTQGNSFRLKP